MKLQGYDSPEAVDELRGHRLLVPSSERPPLEDEDEFYVQDLVGLRVLMHADGSPAGTVTDIFDGTGASGVSCWWEAPVWVGVVDGVPVPRIGATQAFICTSPKPLLPFLSCQPSTKSYPRRDP